MTSARNQVRPDLSMFSAVIAHSQIMAVLPAATAQCLPAGFDDVDIAILEWIAAEGPVSSKIIFQSAAAR
jgi:hypothetical protein